MLPFDDTETPYLYIVNSSAVKNQVVIYKHKQIEKGITSSEETYDLENVTVTDEEIMIEYEGQKETFKRLSKSVAENEDKVQYQYIGPSEE